MPRTKVKPLVSLIGQEIKKDKTSKSDEKSKMGKAAKVKGANYERTLAKAFSNFFGFQLARTPQSGGFAKNFLNTEQFRGDLVPLDGRNFKLHIEAKNQKTWSLHAWLKQSHDDCPAGKKPIVVFHDHGTSKNYVAISLEDFFDLIDKSKVLK